MPRSVAFSGAMKKKQLKERRARHSEKLEEQQQMERARDTIHDNPATNTHASGINPYTGRFVKSMSKEFKPESYGRGVEIQASKLASMKPLELLPESALEVSFHEMFPNVIGFPTRPKWDYSMSREELERNEHRMFEAWMDSIYNKYPTEELSYFEHNLEVWRQLWRVLEISDIIMIIVDIRHPVIHFPPSLYHYVVKDMKRKLVVVFNKVDLVAPNTLFAWTQYFKEEFPELHIASFSCYPPDPTLINDSSTAALQRVVKRPRRRFYNAVGVKDVLVACKDVELAKNGVQVDWQNLISHYDKEKEVEFHDSDEGEEQGDEGEQQQKGEQENLLEKTTTSLETMTVEDEENTPHKDYVTIGLVGHPNVGKSSLINSIMGRTVVSTSRTPGHTKHFQTIHLTHNVRLCDSPGLVFPSLLPKPLQILSGMYPIAQVQEPYSVVDYLSRRINLYRLLKLDPPPNYERGPFRWSAFGICEAYALQRGFVTAKSAHPDVYRAANAILQLANDGRILLSFKPPGFFTSVKYEKLRVAAADAEEELSDKSEDEHHTAKKGDEDGDPGADGSDEDEEEEEEEEEEEDTKAKFQVNSRVGGFFGLLQDDDGAQDDDSESDE
ncbi:Guanine nucleotide-binding-like protein 1 [Mortierella antarctica]|nr:Guanine nucleotide-binding-like protein 1 [Mortierella antarctica]